MRGPSAAVTFLELLQISHINLEASLVSLSMSSGVSYAAIGVARARAAAKRYRIANIFAGVKQAIVSRKRYRSKVFEMQSTK